MPNDHDKFAIGPLGEKFRVRLGSDEYTVGPKSARELAELLKRGLEAIERGETFKFSWVPGES